MSTQLSLDDGLAAKDAGLDRVTPANEEFVTYLREYAKGVSRTQGSVHADDLRVEAERVGLRPTCRQAWGAILRGPGWQKIGTRPSAWPSNHGHVSPIWRWIGA